MIKNFHQLDSLASSHPVSMPVQDPKEIEAIFDTISYKKVNIIILKFTNSPLKSEENNINSNTKI